MARQEYKKIATRQLSEKQLDRAIAETSVMIRNGMEPETAWQEWFKSQAPAPVAARLMDGDIPMLVETLLMEPSEKVMMGRCTDATAKRWQKRINEYMAGSGDDRHAVAMEKGDDGKYVLVLNDILFGTVLRKEPLSVFPTDSFEYKKLKHAAEDLSWRSGKTVMTQNTYYDYGQGWRYTTLIEHDRVFGGIQILSPKEQETVLYGTKDEYESLMSRLSTKLKARQ